MRAARLRHTVEIKRQATGRNDLGENVGVWEVVATRRAAIEPISGKEYFTAGSGEDTKVSTRIIMRWEPVLSDLKPSDRVYHGDVVYDIHSVINTDQMNRELTLMCVRDGG